MIYIIAEVSNIELKFEYIYLNLLLLMRDLVSEMNLKIHDEVYVEVEYMYTHKIKYIGVCNTTLASWLEIEISVC